MPRFLQSVGTDVLVLQEMSGEEELGRLSKFQLEFISARNDITPAKILGKKISWSLELGGGEQRYFNGFVTSFAEAGEGTVAGFAQAPKGHAYFYKAIVHPGLWFLTRASDCRIFQNKSVVDIASEVFNKYPFMSVDPAQLGSEYPKKEFCVQYRETDFNFVCRLLEQEGIYFAFEYDKEGHDTLLLIDPKGASKSVREVPFRSESAAVTDKDHITEWEVNREIQPGKYTIDDFNYLKPGDPITAGESILGDHDLEKFEFYDYPGEYQTLAEGTTYARTRIEELHARYEQFKGEGNVRLKECAPGRRLKLQDHPRRPYNAEYLVTSASYRASAGDVDSGGGTGAAFRCSLTAIGAQTAFRPERKTPKPIIQGPQTAFVVGKAKDEIYTEDDGKGLGRVKVQFHWDRYSKTNENSSCWVRVAQPLAGSGWGFLALPRVGHEVVVEFLEGDPDHPIITGSVYNDMLKPPYKLPGEKTRTGIKTHSSPDGDASTFNELRFEDKKKHEEIYIHAQKDKAIRIKNDRLEWVGNESHLIVKKDVFEKLEADHHVTVKNRNEKVNGTLSLDIAQDFHGKMGMNLAYDAGMEIHLKAGMKVVLEAGMQLTLKAGGSFIDIGPAGVIITGSPLVMINSGGAAGAGSGAKPQPPKEPTREAGTSQGGDMQPPPPKVAPGEYSPQAQMFEMAAASGTPFCEICNC
jgi:type VI secretion system secreted protein VgrG